MQDELNFEGVEKQPLRTFTEKAYLDYSMYVILDRALPALSRRPEARAAPHHLRDERARPRRRAQKHKKSARTVGDVIGKFHPHGDSACYEAMVLMAQDFSYRYPIVDGQGNWGSPDDPKSFAAMRYTESQAHALRRGAAVRTRRTARSTGSRTSTARWRSRRSCRRACRTCCSTARRASRSACRPTSRRTICARSRRPASTCSMSRMRLTRTLMKYVKGPDLPTGGEIVSPRSELLEIYNTGNGSFKARAVYEEEDDDIVITELPYQVSGNKIIEQIAAQMREKKLPMVEDIRDESDHEERDPHRHRAARTASTSTQLMAHLFATTDLERNYRVNINVITLEGKPQGHGPARPARTSGWSSAPPPSRAACSSASTRSQARLHILDGLLAAYLNLDEVIRIIRREDEPKPVLMKRFKLTEIQAEAILETKLRHLAKLEEMKIRDEQKELAEETRGARGHPQVEGEAQEAHRQRDRSRRREVRRRPPHEDRRARSGAGHRRDRARRERAGDDRAFEGRLRALGQGPRDRSAHAHVQDGR